MSRSGYSDSCDGWDLIRWRGAVAAAIRGARGQKLLRDMLAALDAMPEKRRLISGSLEEEGEVCALGCVGKARGMDLSRIDPYDYEGVAEAFGIAQALAQEIAYVNDDWGRRATPEERWRIVRRWVAEQILDFDLRRKPAP